MRDLIEALQILSKYNDYEAGSYTSKLPTHCEHDELSVFVDKPGDVTDEDLARLDELGFGYDSDDERFYSYRFGSC